MTAPAYVRGALVTAPAIEFAAGFRGPDPMALLNTVPLRDPLRMRELHALPFAEIVAFLAETGRRLSLPGNDSLREALHRTMSLSDLTEPLVRATYEQLPSLFTEQAVTAVAHRALSAGALDGWLEADGSAVRPFGARAVHVIAGNNPIIAAITIVRNAITRSDAIIKTPSNDPFTAPAIAATMAEIDAAHPLALHLCALYWKGGDEVFERVLYHPSAVEKIVAWGGFASVRHVTRYIQPGLELISLDPKLSATVIGREAFQDKEAMAHTARLAAADVGVLNQEGCFNARVIYVATGTDPLGVQLANQWGELLYQAVRELPEQVSTPARRFDPDLRASISTLRTSPDWYRVIGGRDDEGAVLVSQLSEPVEFHESLAGRVANVVPIDDPADAVRAMNSYTQTVGVYPESLKRRLRDIAPFYGVQRLVSLGYATHFRPELPQDGMEPTRRMVKWITDETYRPDETHPLRHMCPQEAVW